MITRTWREAVKIQHQLSVLYYSLHTRLERPKTAARAESLCFGFRSGSLRRGKAHLELWDLSLSDLALCMAKKRIGLPTWSVWQWHLWPVGCVDWNGPEKTNPVHTYGCVQLVKLLFKIGWRPLYPKATHNKDFMSLFPKMPHQIYGWMKYPLSIESFISLFHMSTYFLNVAYK